MLLLLFYNAFPLPSGSTATAQFGGNIAAVVSKQGTATPTTYGYAYDGFSRLKEGIHTNSLNEKLITYDANGNITALTRQGGTNPGAFTYTYNGNKLTQLKIGSTAYNYAYDANGNTTTDGMRGFTMTYNLLNLPKRVSKGADYLEYVYDVTGNKLAKKKNNAFTQFYAGSIVYKADKTPEYLIHAEGLALNVSGTFNYQYNINDHLGNTRVVQNVSKTVEQRNDYYPFGLSHSVANIQKNKYLYNGKEIQDETLSGTFFGQLDYGARFYDPVIGRFQKQDRFAERYYGLTPYNYCAGDPINFVDVNGDSIWVAVGDERYYYGKTGKDINGNSKYGFISADGKKYTGGDKFVKALTEALNKLHTGGSNGKELVGFLMNHKDNILIKDAFYNDFDPIDNIVSWDPSSTDASTDVNGNNTVATFINLGHELGHAQDKLEDGKVDYTVWHTDPKTGYKVRNFEIVATHIENLLRAEHNIPLRASYLGKNGKIDEPTRVVRAIKGGGYESVFYHNSGVNIFKRVFPGTGHVY